MGLYLRKSLKVGPFRFNLSGSGVGVSTGIRGLRVGMGPRGNYVHMGRGGLYFRHTLSPSSPRAILPETPQIPSPTQASPAAVAMVEIDSSNVLDMVDSTSSDLLAELNTKRRRMRTWPALAVLLVVVVVSLASIEVPPWILAVVLMSGAGLFYAAFNWDEVRKSTVIFYDLDPESAAAYQHFHEAFDGLGSSAAVWHIASSGNVRDTKYHAGANTLVKRHAVRPFKGALPFVKTNLEIPQIPVGRQLLAFLPDRMLVFDPGGVGAVGYSDIKFESRQTRFIEEDAVPNDAKVVDQTWKYVNRNGGPDRRFASNPQLPVTLYEDVRLSSASGLNELLQVSRLGVIEPFVGAAGALATHASTAPDSAAWSQRDRVE